MTGRWWLWLPVVALTLAVGVYALRLGWVAATITETDVIERYAAVYVGETGAARTDCRAVPGQGGAVWLVVICGPVPFDPARHYEYHANRLGGLVFQGGPSSWDDAVPHVLRGLPEGQT